MSLTLKLLFLVLLLFVSSHHVDSGSIVKFLPGFEGPLPFELETGYIGIGEEEDIQLFYYIKSENNPIEDPLLIWLNGGPGCSSLLGLLFEKGPLAFKFEVANILFLDQPVGSGFSYSRTPLDKTSDTNEVKMIHESGNNYESEEKLKKRSVALVPFRRLIARGWAPSGVASSLDGRPAFGSGVRAFFSGVGLPVQVFPVTVSSGRISVFGVASISVNVRLLLLAPLPSSPVLDSRLLSPCHAPPWWDRLMSIVFSKRRSSERPEFQRRPFWMDGFFSVKALFRRSSFQPLQFRRRMTALHRLDACPVVAGQPNTWWTRLAFFFNRGLFLLDLIY
ncbi:hypothetical protein YC2023_084162 [Brassica napus]